MQHIKGGKEASEIIEVVQTYKTILREQVIKMFPPEKELVVKQLITRIARDQRIRYDKETGLLTPYGYQGEPEKALICCMWVVLDFIRDIEFHAPAEFPVSVIFLMKENIYEVIYVATEREMVMNMACNKCADDAKRLIVITDTTQIHKIHIPGAISFCIVGADHKISYYKIEKRND